jgi:uncharacterized membrane protein
MRHVIELVGQAIEALAVVIIAIAIVHGTVRYLFNLNQKVADAYTLYRVQLGRALLLGLEFLVAADIIRTVALETTMQRILFYLSMTWAVCTEESLKGGKRSAT